MQLLLLLLSLVLLLAFFLLILLLVVDGDERCCFSLSAAAAAEQLPAPAAKVLAAVPGPGPLLAQDRHQGDPSSKGQKEEEEGHVAGPGSKEQQTVVAAPKASGSSRGPPWANLSAWPRQTPRPLGPGGPSVPDRPRGSRKPSVAPRAGWATHPVGTP